MSREDMDVISNLFQSLESELKKDLAQVRQEMREQYGALSARQDQTNARLDRIGGVVNGGARAIAKMIDWTERTDLSLADVLRRQAGLEERLRKLDGNNQE